jgi:hypothetical protein
LGDDQHVGGDTTRVELFEYVSPERPMNWARSPRRRLMVYSVTERTSVSSTDRIPMQAI